MHIRQNRKGETSTVWMSMSVLVNRSQLSGVQCDSGWRSSVQAAPSYQLRPQREHRLRAVSFNFFFFNWNPNILIYQYPDIQISLYTNILLYQNIINSDNNRSKVQIFLLHIKAFWPKSQYPDIRSSGDSELLCGAGLSGKCFCHCLFRFFLWYDS